MTTYWVQLLRARLLYDADRSVAGDDDADVTGWVKTAKFILATQIGYDAKDTAAAAYKLYWRNVTDSGSFAEVGATGEIKYSATSAVLADDTAVTSTTRRCTAATGQTWQDGYESINDNRCPSGTATLNLGSDYYSELQFGLDPSGAHDGDEYEFQLFNITLGSAVGTCLCTLTMATSYKTKTYLIDTLLASRQAKTYDIDMRIASRTLKTYDIDMVLSEATEPSGSKQVIMGGYYDDLNASTTEYNVLQGASTWLATESYVTVPWPTSGKFTNLTAEVDSRLTAGGYTLTLRKNGADTDLSLALTSSSRTGLDTSEVTVAAGDLICLKAAPNSPTGTPYAFWGVTFIPDTAGETVMCGAIDRAASAATVYAPWMCGAPYNFDTADNWAYASCMPVAGTMKKLYARTTSTTDGTNKLTFTLYWSPDTSTNLSAECAASNTPDTTDEIDVSEWQAAQMRVVQSGTVADGYCRWAAVFVPDTAGQFIFAGQSTDAPSATATEYNGLNGQFYSSVWDANETRYTMRSSEDFTAKKIMAMMVSGPGGSGKSRTFTLRRSGTSDTALTVSTETDTAISASIDASITQQWNLNMKHSVANTPTVSASRWAVVGYIEPTGGGATTKDYLIDMRLAARTAKTYNIDVMLASRQIKTYDIDARVATRKTQTYDADTLVANRKTAVYDVDTRLAARKTTTYDADMVAATRKTTTYDIDALLRKRTTVEYAVDALVAQRKTQPYDIDAYIAQRLTKAYDVDARVAQRLSTSYDIDTWLRNRGTKAYNIDALLAARRTAPYDIDAWVAQRTLKTYDIDAQLASRKTSTYDIDVILAELGTKTKAYDIDLLLAARLAEAYDIDALLASRKTSTYDIDVYLRKRNTASYDIDTRLAQRQTQVYDVDTQLASRKTTAYDVDARLATRKTASYDIDAYLRLRQLASYDIDLRAASRNEVSYLIDVILQLAGVGVISKIDGIPWANVAKVYGIPKAQIAKVNGWSTS